jgi:NMD protein affecting ribosome stability and mRNA decay
MQIVTIHGNTIKMINLSKWDESTVDIRAIQKGKILGNKELIEEMILVSQTKDEIQIMDPKSYEIKIIKKPKPIEFKKEKVKILKTEKQIFLIPDNN